MLVVGLTGGIGSGKTAVSDRFAELGVPVIDTDVLAREVVEPGEPALRLLVEAFGKEIMEQGKLNRNRLRRIAFATPENKARIEAILHPAILDRLKTRLEGLESTYCIVVVPLLVETNFDALVDRILVVEAPRERRLRWIESSRKLDRGEIEKIMDNQASSEERLRIADDVIMNDGDLDDLRDKVHRLHAKYSAIPKSVE